MVFSSTIFLFAFLPLFLAVYFALRWRKARNVWLLIASLAFYAWGEPVYIVLLIVSIIANWLFGRGLAGCRESGGRKPLLALAIVFNILILGFFKYEGFLVDSINGLAGTALVPELDLPLPIGISFFTLQAISYIIDAYRGEIAPQRNVLFFGMYLASFPQLIAGPIVRYQTIEDQVLGRTETLSDFTAGMRLFSIGLAKKTVLANTCGTLVDGMTALGGTHIGAIGAWACMLAFALQIYFDFSGYSDMAIGIGRMMGFSYLRNFNYPYISRSLVEFWGRWHISLGMFMRSYVYIPLGGSRCSTRRWVFNIVIVWGLIGLWHGAEWHFVFWGLLYGALLIGEKLLWGRVLAKLPGAIRILYTNIIMLCASTLFLVGDPGSFVRFWEALVGLYGATGGSTFWQLGVWAYLPVLIVCVLAATPILPYLKERFVTWAEGRKSASILAEGGRAYVRNLGTTDLCSLDAKPASEGRARACDLVLAACNVGALALIALSAAAVVTGGFNPFIYFQF